MKKMKKLVASLLALGCIFAVGGFTACDKGNGDGTNAQQGLGKLELNIQTHTMLLNKTIALKAERRDVEVEGVTWSSSNTAVATVDSNGVVTSVGFGETTITATVGKETATCLVRVPEVSTDGVVFADKEVKLTVGGEKKLSAMVTPMIASNKEVTWTSEDESIATVDANGKVTGVTEGETIVTVTTVDGGKTATCKIIVGKAIETFALSETEITLMEGSTYKVAPIITPADAVIQDLVWTSSDEEIAVYSGMAVVGVGEGTATLTATTVDGGKTATVTVTVLPYIDVTSVAFDKEVMNVANGTTVQLNATVLPADATDSRLKWLSSDMSIATVDANGVVTLRQEGSVTVTATSVADGEIFDSVELNVIGTRAAFNNKYYSPEGDFTYTAYGVNEVKFNGTALEASEYTYEDSVLTIAKSVLAGKTTSETNTLTLVSAESGDVDLTVKVLEAKSTRFGVGEIGTEVLGELENFRVKKVNSDGSIVLEVTASGMAVVALDVEYMKAMFAYPNTEALELKFKAGAISGGTDYARRGVKEDGTLGFFGHGKLTTSETTARFSRALFNHIYANRMDEENGGATAWRRNIMFYFEDLAIGDEVIVTGVVASYSGTGGQSAEYNNRVIMDNADALAWELGSPTEEGSLTRFHVDANNRTAIDGSYTITDGNVITLTHGAPVQGGTYTIQNRNGRRYWFASPNSTECFFLWSGSGVPSQILEKGTEYAYDTKEVLKDLYWYDYSTNSSGVQTYLVPAGEYKIVKATLDGADIMAGEVAGVSVVGSSVVFSAEYAGAFGEHSLEVVTQKTTTFETEQWVSHDRHIRTISVVSEIETAPTDPYGVNFYNGANTALVGDNAAGKSYFTSSVVTLDGNKCLKWNKNTDASEPSFYFSNTATGNWLDSVRADDTIESFSFDVKAGDAGKTPTIAFFCQWGSDKNYVTGVDKGNGWVTFTIPATDYYNEDKFSEGEYWMKVWYNAEMTDVPTSLYFDNFRVNYVQA